MGRVKPLYPGLGPSGDKRRWGFAVVIGVEEYYSNPQGWLSRSKKRLRVLAESEGFQKYTDAEFQYLMKVILSAVRGWHE